MFKPTPLGREHLVRSSPWNLGPYQEAEPEIVCTPGSATAYPFPETSADAISAALRAAFGLKIMLFAHFPVSWMWVFYRVM